MNSDLQKICDSFKRKFSHPCVYPKDDYVYLDGSIMAFKMDGKQIQVRWRVDHGEDLNELDDEEIDSLWQIITYYIVDRNFIAADKGDKGDWIKVIGDANIKYELYPMEQGEEFNVADFGFGNLETCEMDDSIFFSKFCFDGINISEAKKFTINEQLELFVANNGDDPVTYALVKDNKIVSGFLDMATVYQLGDGETICYFDPMTKSVIVHNEGDVSSIVIIHLNNFL